MLLLLWPTPGDISTTINFPRPIFNIFNIQSNLGKAHKCQWWVAKTLGQPSTEHSNAQHTIIATWPLTAFLWLTALQRFYPKWVQNGEDDSETQSSVVKLSNHYNSLGEGLTLTSSWHEISKYYEAASASISTCKFLRKSGNVWLAKRHWKICRDFIQELPKFSGIFGFGGSRCSFLAMQQRNTQVHSCLHGLLQLTGILTIHPTKCTTQLIKKYTTITAAASILHLSWRQTA